MKQHLEYMVWQVVTKMLYSTGTFSFVCQSKEEAQYVFDTATELFSSILLKLRWEVANERA